MGGVIAAGYAAGLSPDDLEQLFTDTPMREVLHVRPSGAGLLGLDRIAQMLDKTVGKRCFADLRVPLALTAVDLESGKEIVLTEGKVGDAVLATIALPGIFPPQLMGEHRLIDGGALDPVPVAPVRRLHPAPVVAVALSPSPERWQETRSPNPLAALPVLGMLTRLRPSQAFQVFMRTMEIVLRTYTEVRLQLDRPEVIVRPEVWGIGLFEEASAAEMAKLGGTAMVAALPALRSQFTAAARFRRGLTAAFASPSR
jgi:NTE family protein